MKHILFILCFVLLAFLSCTKESDNNIVQATGSAPAKNEFRAKTISGKNNHWGEFKLVLSYRNEKLDTARLLNSKGVKVGKIDVKLSSSTYQTYTLYDFVPKIDPDSIQRVNAKLTELYGAGNFTLEDSIPRSVEKLYTAALQQDKYTREITLIRNYYGPVDEPGSGEDYIYKYRKIRQIMGKYEYEPEGNLIAERLFLDTYDPEDDEKYERQITKYDYLYNGKQLSSVVYNTADAGENFTETDRYQFVYSNNRLTAINGQYLTKQFTYAGDKLSGVSYDGKNCTYESDSHGNVTKIDYGNGNYMQIEYETGNGNLSQFLSIFDRMMGNPYIR